MENFLSTLDTIRISIGGVFPGLFTVIGLSLIDKDRFPFKWRKVLGAIFLYSSLLMFIHELTILHGS
jgi:hypothetical protein